ncbi:MAG: cupin domain-containing protein [Saprospiraceae bacterium]
MNKSFITATEREKEVLDWGTLFRLSGPQKTNAENLVVIEVNITPGNGHNFHKHPQQEEVIYVVEGEIEQWVGQEKRILTNGDSVFIPADGVHASFNVGTRDAKLLAILSPCIGDEGYELVEVFDQAPWNTLR